MVEAEQTSSAARWPGRPGQPPPAAIRNTPLSTSRTAEHPDGDGQWQPDQQAGDEVFAHAGVVKAGGVSGRCRSRHQAVPAAAACCGPPLRTDSDSALSAGRRQRERQPAEAPPPKSVTYQPEPLSWKPAAVTV